LPISFHQPLTLYEDALALLFFVIDFSQLNSSQLGVLTGDVAPDTFCLNPEQKSCSYRSTHESGCQLKSF
jgi:hypothetical protein